MHSFGLYPLNPVECTFEYTCIRLPFSCYKYQNLELFSLKIAIQIVLWMAIQILCSMKSYKWPWKFIRWLSVTRRCMCFLERRLIRQCLSLLSLCRCKGSIVACTGGRSGILVRQCPRRILPPFKLDLELSAIGRGSLPDVCRKYSLKIESRRYSAVVNGRRSCNGTMNWHRIVKHFRTSCHNN